MFFIFFLIALLAAENSSSNSENNSNTSTNSPPPKTGARWGKPPPELLAQFMKIKNRRKIQPFVDMPLLQLEIVNNKAKGEAGRVHILNRTTLPIVRNSGNLWFVKLFVFLNIFVKDLFIYIFIICFFSYSARPKCGLCMVYLLFV